MRRLVLGLVAVAMVSGVGCGGHGRGFRTPANPIFITSTLLPLAVSGQVIDHPIAYTGGTGGPYQLEVISGALPPGLELDNDTVALVGQILADGTYDFTIKLTDKGSLPFSFDVKAFHWEVPIGPLVFATDAILPTLIFNQFGSITLQVAGGVPPYACDVVSANLDEQFQLPTGMVIPQPSTTIVGSPIGAFSTYTVDIRATDSTQPVPLTTVKTFTINVLIPPILVTTTSLANGRCGVAYNDVISVSDGIPPFNHEVVLPSSVGTMGPAAAVNARLRGAAPSINAVAKGDPLSAYALETAAGPYSGKFPEGLRLRPATGAIVGTPRRTGVFNAWQYHVHSTTLPLNPTQNVWRQFSFSMADGAPPNLLLDDSVLTAGSVWSGTSNFILDPDANRPYSRQLLTTGGVSHDGRSDSPRDGEDVVDPNETPGQSRWTVTSVTGSVGSLAAVGMELTLGGLLRGTGAGSAVGNQRTGLITLAVRAEDAQLPTPHPAAHFAAGTCRFSIGPDLVIITESTAAHTATNVNSTFAPTNSYNHVSFEANNQSVFVYEPYAVGPTVRALTSADLTATHLGLPGGVTPDTLLRNVDMMAVTVNPTWWAYDAYNHNPRAARALQHADLQRLGRGQGYNADAMGTTSYANASYGTNTFERNGDACIELPYASNVPGVSAGNRDLGTGVYADGGQLRAFEGASHFGFFVVRKDSKIYVPFALAKGAWQGFGDAVLTNDRTTDGVKRRLQITVSPDGRFAACVIKNVTTNFILTSTATNVNIVVFSLTGEKLFGGDTWRQFNTGGSLGGTTDGQYMYGSSMTLTNRSLYFLKGNNHGAVSATDCAVAYTNHWVYRVANIVTDTPALLNSGFGGTGSWTNSASSPLSTWFHRWAPPGATSLNSSTSQWVGSTGGTGTMLLSTTTTGTRSPADFYAGNWANFAENSAAPHPFRVNAAGNTVVILAAGTSTGAGTPATSTFMNKYVYVDFFDGSAFDFRGVGSAMRRYGAPTRLSGIIAGEKNCRLWGYYSGPATQVEVSDDGRAIGAVYNSHTGTWQSNMLTSISSAGASFREELLVLTATGSVTQPWSTSAEDNATLSRFTGGMNWRFGALAFTRNASNGAGSLLFWGGTDLNGATTYNTDTNMSMWSGSLFRWNLQTSACEGILLAAAGGIGTSVATYTPGSPFSTVPSYYNTSGRGSLQMFSYFISPDGRFAYYESFSPLVDHSFRWSGGAQSTGMNRTMNRLVGVNILDNSTTINGFAPLRGFAVGSSSGQWPSDPGSRGFTGVGGTSQGHPQPAQHWSFGAAPSNIKVGQTVSSHGSNGTIYFSSYEQDNSWGDSAGTVYYYGYRYGYWGYFPYYQSPNYDGNNGGWGRGGPGNNPPWSDGGHYAGEVFAFNANVGGNVVNLTNFGNHSTYYGVSRIISYMQPNNAGTKVAFVRTESTSPYYSHTMSDRERIYTVSNVNFSTTGALSTTPAMATVEASNGRAGPSMAWDFSDTRLYYAFGPTTNENTMSLKEATLNASGTAVTLRTHSTGFFGGTARFAVLNSSR